MRLSDTGLRQRQTKALYPNHRLPPWPNEDEARDRSNRLLGPDDPNEQRAHNGRQCMQNIYRQSRANRHYPGL
jgi:hypothetical protein